MGSSLSLFKSIEIKDKDDDDKPQQQFNCETMYTTKMGPTNIKYSSHPSTILGTGSTAIVFSGYHFGIEKPAAVKFIRKDYLRVDVDQVNELKIWTKIDQDVNIVRLYDSYKEPNVGLFLAMEKAERTFRNQITMYNPKRYEVIHWLRQVANAVGFLHGKGVIHRDIKPDNILLILQDGNKLVAKLADFGASKILSSTEQTETNSLSRDTHLWIAPEARISGNKKLKPTKLQDIYALGMTMYFGLSKGCQNFSSSEDFGTMAYGPFSKPLSFDELSVNNLLSRMMSRKPWDRPSIKQVLSHCLFWDWKQEKYFFMQAAICLSNQACEEIQELTECIDLAYTQFFSKFNSGKTFNWIKIAEGNNFNIVNMFTTPTRNKFRKEYGNGESVTKFMKLFRDKYVHFTDMQEEAIMQFSGRDGIFSEELYVKTLTPICPGLLSFLYFILWRVSIPNFLSLYKTYFPLKTLQILEDERLREEFLSRETTRWKSNIVEFNADGVFVPVTQSLVLNPNVNDRIGSYEEYPNIHDIFSSVVGPLPLQLPI